MADAVNLQRIKHAVCKTRSVGPNSDTLLGTGFLIRPRRVLTCRHCIGPDGKAELEFVTAGVRCKGVLVDDLEELLSALDLACLDLIPADGPAPDDLSPLADQWLSPGWSVEERVECQITGFPATVRDMGMSPLGTVRDPALDIKGIRSIHLHSPEAADRLDGLSGSPVVHRGRVVGVVSKQLKALDGLGEVVPVHEAVYAIAMTFDVVECLFPPILAPPFRRTGALPLESPAYVERAIDQRAHRDLAPWPTAVRITGAHGTGKTSLLQRLAEHERTRSPETTVVQVNYNDFAGSDLDDSERLLERILNQIRSQCGLTRVQLGVDRLTAPQEAFMERLEELLDAWQGRLLLVLDDLDAVISGKAGADLMRMLRQWVEYRGPHRARLKLIVAIADQAHILNQQFQGSLPGAHEVHLDNAPFTDVEVGVLLARYRLNSLVAPQDFKAIGGHPHLVHLAVIALADGQADTVEQLVRDANESIGWAAPHFRGVLMNLSADDQRNLRAIQGGGRIDAHVATNLERRGLLKRQGDRRTWRYPLYEKVFGRWLS